MTSSQPALQAPLFLFVCNSIHRFYLPVNKISASHHDKLMNKQVVNRTPEIGRDTKLYHPHRPSPILLFPENIHRPERANLFPYGLCKTSVLDFSRRARRRKIFVPLRFEHEHAKTFACRSLCSFMFRSESAPTGKRFALSGRPGFHFKTSIPSNEFRNRL